MKHLKPRERKTSFDEVAQGYSDEEAKEEANRCLQCKKPACVKTCPLNQDAKGYNAAIAQGDYQEALRIIMKDNPLPASCGRVCPHPCETKCIRGIKGDPVAMASLKRFAADNADPYKLGIEPGEDTGKTVGIIGAGPGGLGCAYHLALMGHKAVIYESLPVVGGMLSVGIPEYRLPRTIIKKEVDFIKSLGVKIKTGAKITSLDELDHDAIFIGVGAHIPIELKMEGTGLFGVDYGTAFLRSYNLGKGPKIGKKVAIIGGGNVAIDAARTAVRLGAEDVRVLYRRTRKEMPAWDVEIDEAEAEGVRFEYLVSPVKIIGKGDYVNALECLRMNLGECDESGRCRPEPVKGSNFTIDVDNVISAISQCPDLDLLEDDGVGMTPRCTIITDGETGITSRKGVFAGGDCVTGAATVVEALAAGKMAAESIHDYLMKG